MPPKINYPFFKATTFLILGGGIVCATTVLKLIAILTPCEYDDKIMDILSPIADFTHFCIIIWGSVVVFGKFCSFHYTSQGPMYQIRIDQVGCTGGPRIS